MSLGFVSLVGAGPGHPDHLTVRAARRLREAEVVLHDALVSGGVLALAPSARLVDVGKRRGEHRMAQGELVQLLIDSARAGRRVVRLKGGDPFVFGRGGEEAIALLDAGIPFEVVPGITSAVAAPELAGIPVTHRGCSHGFIVLTGSPIDQLDDTLSSLPQGRLTLVILMAVQVRRQVVTALSASGWSGDTPSALVVGASEQSWLWRGPLSELAGVEVPASHRDRPGTIVIGEVVALPMALVDGIATPDEATAAATLLEGALHVGAR